MKSDGMVQQGPHVPASFPSQFKESGHSSSGRLRKKVEKAAFVLVHSAMLTQPPSAINDVR